MNYRAHREKKRKQDHPALLKAKYCPWVAAVSRTQKRTKAHVTLTFEYDLEIKYGSRGCRDTRSCKMSSS